MTVLKHLGLPDEEVTVVPWDELDRVVVPDHLTSIWVPRLGEPFAAEFVRLEELARPLRARCPWDRVQTHQSLTRYLLEESYEALEAIEELGPDGSGYEHLEEELGDVLFQVVFHSVLASEEGQFALADVARNVHDKLVLRHPHVFGDVEANTAEDVNRNWEQIKRKEKGRASIMDDVPREPAGPSLCPQNPEESGLCRLRLGGSRGRPAQNRRGAWRAFRGDCRRRAWSRQKRRWHLATRVRSGTSWGTCCSP